MLKNKKKINRYCSSWVWFLKKGFNFVVQIKTINSKGYDVFETLNACIQDQIQLLVFSIWQKLECELMPKVERVIYSIG